jgi:hypothetical protein
VHGFPSSQFSGAWVHEPSTQTSVQQRYPKSGQGRVSEQSDSGATGPQTQFASSVCPAGHGAWQRPPQQVPSQQLSVLLHLLPLFLHFLEAIPAAASISPIARRAFVATDMFGLFHVARH